MARVNPKDSAKRAKAEMYRRLILESADLERRPLAQVSPGRYSVRVWVKDLDGWRASYDEWQRLVVEWSDTGRLGSLPAIGPSPEIWLIQARIS